jgi:hypothetical protein
MDICPTPTQPRAQAAADADAPISIDWAAELAAAEGAAAASATYPFPLPSDHKPFDDISSEEEEQPHEAQWIADLIEGRNPFAAAGSRPPYGNSSSKSAAGRGSEAAAAAAAGSSSGGGGAWDAAKHRRRHKERVGFRRQDIPTIKVDWTGNEMVSGHAAVCAWVRGAEGGCRGSGVHLQGAWLCYGVLSWFQGAYL